ncbi:MAG: hypothetical protein ACREX8_05615 [Gammaproteobacteria bacterium]
MSGAADFEVEPEELRKAGDNAVEIGDQVFRDHDDLPDQAGTVSVGLDGFALGGALTGCTQAWCDELASVANQTREAGEQLVATADAYRKTDSAVGGDFDTIASALTKPDG